VKEIILARLANTTAHLTPTQVLTRFAVRTAILTVFASFGTIGFGRSLAALLWMTIILCAVIGTLRRERVFAAGLNHWDEMVAYTALYCAITELNQLSSY
jgi:hypothetical protein